jgi:DNA-directed RNA polymerase subunit F
MKPSAWSQSNETYRQVSTTSIKEKLEPGLYIPGVDMSGFFLTQYGEKYNFPYKIYGINNDFITRIEKTYKSTSENIGVLLNGLKGTGKSVTAELLCNRFMEMFNMPVILINNRMNGLIEFLAGINQDVVIFVDEYEKVFVSDDGRSVQSTEILTLMDGALKSEHRRLFLFTTNNKHIDDNLLERPGRIRYVKEFSDLNRETIEEIVDDLLVYPEYREECTEFISRLNKITIDIVKAVINEVNIHNQSPENFRDVFNVFVKADYFEIYTGELTELETLKTQPLYTKIEFMSFDIAKAETDILYVEQCTHQNKSFIIKSAHGNTNLGFISDYKNGVITTFTCDDWTDDDKPINPVYKKYTITTKKAYHNSYVNAYDF